MSDNSSGSRGVRRRTGAGGPKGGPAWLLALLLVLVAGAILAFFLVRNSGDDKDETGLDTQAPASAQNSLTVGGRLLLDEAAAGRLSALAGQPVEGRAATVQSVVADEGFWAGADQNRRVFIFLTPQARTKVGESPFQVRAGQSVDLTGTLKALPDDLTPFGVEEPEGAAQLRSRGQYVEATAVRLSSG